MSDNEPVAWAVMVRWEYRDICDTLAEAKRRAEGITYWDGDDLVTAGVLPLYRSPQTCPHVVGKTTLHCSLTPFTLTDEERAAIEWASTVEWGSNPHAATLRALLERTK
jgi:hypothetical protein